jgi:hypothetical protein
MHPVFLQPEHLCKAELLSFMSNGSMRRRNPFGPIAILCLSAQRGRVVCAPCLHLRLIGMLPAYWWPICLTPGWLPIS